MIDLDRELEQSRIQEAEMTKSFEEDRLAMQTKTDSLLIVGKAWEASLQQAYAICCSKIAKVDKAANVQEIFQVFQVSVLLVGSC